MAPTPDQTVNTLSSGIPDQKNIDAIYWWLSLVLLIGCVTATWVNHFANVFHQDDTHIIINNPAVRTGSASRIIGSIRAAGDSPEYSAWRPVTTLSFALDYSLLNGTPVAFHLDSFVWFAWLVLAVYWLTRAMPGAGPYTALFAAALAALHPLMADNLNYVSQRHLIGRGVALAFATALFFSWPHRLPQTIWYELRRVPKNEWDVLMRRVRSLVAGAWQFVIALPIPWYFLPLILGLLADPGTAVFPLILLAWIRIFEPERPVRQIIPAGVLCAVWWLAHTAITFAPSAPLRKAAFPYWITQFLVLARYLAFWIYPANLSPVSDLRPFSDLASMPALGGIVAVLVIVVLATFAGRSQNFKITAFGLWWFLLTAVPEFLLPQARVESLDRAIVPIIGLGISFSGLAWWLVKQSSKNEAWRWPAAFAILAGSLGLLAWFLLTANVRNRSWQSEEALWTDALEHSPSNAEALLRYGRLRIANGDAEEGYKYLEKARTADPENGEVAVSLGQFAEAAGKADSEEHFRRAISLAPSSAPVLAAYSDWLLIKSRNKEALDAANKAVQLDPLGIPGRTAVMNAQLADRQWNEALAFGRRTLELLPGDPDAIRGVNVATGAVDELAAAEKRAKSDPTVDNYLQLSTIHMQNGRFEEGIAACRAALKINPELAEAWSNLSVGYHMLGRTDESIAALREAIRLRPDLPNLKDNLEAELASKARQAAQSEQPK